MKNLKPVKEERWVCLLVDTRGSCRLPVHATTADAAQRLWVYVHTCTCGGIEPASPMESTSFEIEADGPVLARLRSSPCP